ncbi:MAG TPA: carboxypeptidase regulatory-like domain-containing protein [Verrucomicrobiae bacterium]|jgi:Carboxypeptidase regulatory-like domain|nr:carboxypeptidase regulatory-like domain-containing protein [Verrucomicrobiae bacterium]
MSFRARWTAFGLVVALCLLLPIFLAAQGASGRVIGRVSDPSGAVLNGVRITLTNQATGVSREATTNESGDYSFVNVAPATYQASFQLQGFKKNVQKGITVDVNQVVTLNSTLQIGGTQEVVDVTSEAPQVDTTSTQLGAVINDRSVNELPLNSRDTYQFLQLQPGVQAQLGNGNGSLFYGSQDTGSVSVNGGRTRANNFSVNGGDANDQFVNLPTVQPTPDSVEEFRVLTNTFDAEYGRNSGSVVNVITKSGTNGLHGDIYEYFRNTVLDAKNFFDVNGRPQWNQNQYGGTLGGPIIKDRTFYFVSYEGRRVREGITGQAVNVPTTAQRTGDFSSLGGFAGGISNTFVAQALDGRAGCDSALGLPSGGIASLPVDPNTGVVDWSTVFPTGMIPAACQDPVASSLMGYIPTSSVTVPVSTDNEDQFTVRFDHKINDHQNFTAYYYFNDLRQLQPFNQFEQAGANVPGFGNFNNNRFQQWNLTHDWTINNSVVNEAHFTYMREGQLGFLKPQTTGAVTSFCNSTAAAYCFTGMSDSSAINSLIASSGIPTGKAGITPGLPTSLTGVPFVSIGGGAILGNNSEGILPQVGNSFQWSDELTWVKGTHTIKFGVDLRRQRFDQYYYYDINGSFGIDSSGPNAIIPGDGDNYAGFLLGLVDTYGQGSGQREDVRATSVYPFVQDSWKIKPNLTLNYGLRWELDTPPTDIAGHVETFRPGQNSTVYPCGLSALSQSYFGVSSSDCNAVGVTPTGLVVPGDKGIPAGMTSTYYKAFAPRIGIAYSPGNSGKTSIRAGWGLFYNPIEELVLAQFGAEPPFGGSSYIYDTFFNTPFVYQAGGAIAPNPFDGILTPTKGQPVDYSLFRPLLLYGEFQPHLRTQYTAQYNLTVQHEFAKDLMLQVGYVGSQGHRLLASHDINPSNPQTCLDIASIASMNAANVTSYGSQYSCGPTVEDSQWSVTIPTGFQFHMPNGTILPGTGQQINLVGLRPYSSPNCNSSLPALTLNTGCPVDGIPIFSSIFAEDTIASSSYNALEAMLEKRFSHGLQFQASYTFSKSIDDGSTFEETLDPFNYARSRALSLFNSAQRFVISYDWELPIRKYQGFKEKLFDDWAVSGITQFQSGFPIRLNTEDDTELIASQFFLGTEAPSLVQPFQKLNPKTNGGFWFDPNDFATAASPNASGLTGPPLGQFNNGTQRSICCGPGLNEWDFAVHKKISLTEDKYFQFRAELFNIFNKTNFYNPDGNFSDGPTEFGKVTEAQDPRLVQFALKFYF